VRGQTEFSEENIQYFPAVPPRLLRGLFLFRILWTAFPVGLIIYFMRRLLLGGCWVVLKRKAIYAQILGVYFGFCTVNDKARETIAPERKNVLSGMGKGHLN
jgi:hypothetical protein